MSRPFPPIAAIAALLLASIGVAVPSHALDSHELPGDTPSTPRVPRSFTTIDARTVLAAGRITDSNGLPASGVPVTAYAYPAELPTAEGAEFELTPVGTAVTDRSGNYQLRGEATALRPLATEASAALGAEEPAPVNLDILAGTGEGAAMYPVTVWATPDLSQVHVKAADLPAATAATDEASMSTAAQNAITASATAGGPRVDLALESGVQMTPEATTAAYQFPSSCNLTKNYGKRGVTLAQLSATVATGGFSQRFTFSSSASSTVGAAILRGGVFKAEGTYTVGSSGSDAFPAQKAQGSKSMRSEFVFGRLFCSYGTVNPTTKTKVQAIDHAGGTNVTSSTTPRATKCVDYKADSTYKTESTTATTFSGGATTSGIVGFNLSARTGYNTSAQIVVNVTKARAICGTTGYPRSDAGPGRVVVRPAGSQ